jgi:tyrosinase
MTHLTRRGFLAAASAIPFAEWLKGNVLFAQGPMVRYDARSAQGIKMLASYAKAVKIMQNKADGDPLSWVFQWYTHCVKGSQAPNQQTPQKNAALAASYPPGTPAQKAIAVAAWNTCQAHYSGTEDSFLPWHRMYVYFFETIIRKLSENAEFTLPYWDYSVTGPNHGVIPPQFGMPNDPVFKALYVQKRNPGVNAGTPIDQNAPTGSLSVAALDKCDYSTNGANSGFCEELDSKLHGNVHVLVGNVSNMGAVPWAAGDPIFWMHHCNIDRLWASWNKAGRSNPTSANFKALSFTFADSNGNAVVAKNGDFYDTVPLHYTYDRFEPVKPCLRRPFFPPIVLNRIPRLPIGPDPVALLTAAGRGARLNAALPAMDPQARVFLTIKGLEAAENPGVLYNVYFEPPTAAETRGTNRYQVGVINFFHPMRHENETPAYSFDVTDLLKLLRETRTLRDEPRVSIVPAGQPASSAKPVIGEVSLVQQ